MTASGEPSKDGAITSLEGSTSFQSIGLHEPQKESPIVISRVEIKLTGEGGSS